jgi:hypothetical protein
MAGTDLNSPPAEPNQPRVRPVSHRSAATHRRTTAYPARGCTQPEHAAPDPAVTGLHLISAGRGVRAVRSGWRSPARGSSRRVATPRSAGPPPSRRGTVSCTRYRVISPLAVPPSARLHDHIRPLACKIPMPETSAAAVEARWRHRGVIRRAAVYTAFRSSLMTSAAVESSSSRIFTYRVVVVRSPWPRRCRTRSRSTPWSISHEACVCRTW